MILTGEIRRSRRKTRHSATLPTTNFIWTGPGSTPGISDERKVIKRVFKKIHNRRAWSGFNWRRRRDGAL
jgi:hypothetical protein